jgi:hypothetical protein
MRVAAALPAAAAAGLPEARAMPLARLARCPRLTGENLPSVLGKSVPDRRKPSHAPLQPPTRRRRANTRTTTTASAAIDLVNSLAADAAYLGLASTLVSVSGFPLLKTGGVHPTADATRRTPQPAFILSSLISFLPLINWAAWLLLMVTEGPRKRYWAYACLYALPFVLAATGAGGETLALEGAALCALHFQVERLALAALDARDAAAVESVEGGASEWDAAAAALEADADAAALESFDARLGARCLARGPRLRALAAAAGVPRAKSARKEEVVAGLEAALEAAEGGAGGGGGGRLLARSGSGRRGAVVAAATAAEEAPSPAWRDELVAEVQAALDKEAGRGGGRRRSQSPP